MTRVCRTTEFDRFDGGLYSVRAGSGPASVDLYRAIHFLDANELQDRAISTPYNRTVWDVYFVIDQAGKLW